MLRRISMFIFLFACSRLFALIALTETERAWLKEKQILRVLVSETNIPYEFRDEEGQLKGINIDILKNFARDLQINVTFSTDLKGDYDLISSFTNKNTEKFKFSRVLYRTRLYTYTKKRDQELEQGSNIYILNQQYIQDYLSSMNMIFNINQFRDIRSAYQSFLADPKGIFILDNFHLPKFKEDLQYRKLSFKEINYEKEFLLYINNADLPLFNILSKTIYENEVRNNLFNIFEKWDMQINRIQGIYTRAARQLTIIIIISGFLFVSTSLLLIRAHLFARKVLTENINKEETINKIESELQKLSYSLMLSESKNKNVLENINSIAMSLDLEGNILYVNSMIKTLLGYDPDVLTNSPITDFLPENEARKLLSVFSNQVDQERYTSNEIIVSSREGSKKSFIFTAMLNKIEDGSHTINCVLQDISERKELETKLESYANHLEELVKQRTQRLKDSEERFRILIEKSFDGICLIDEDRFIFVNPAFISLSGYNLDELETMQFNMLQFIIQEDKEKYIEQYEKFNHKEIKSFHVESGFINKYEDQFYAEINLSRIIYNAKEVELGLIRDITEKKKSEMERMEKERLQVVSQLAITANDRINSPLNAINGYTEMLELQMKNKTVAQENAFKNIYQSTKIIENIMRKLKSLASIKLKDYKLKDTKMFDLDDQFSDSDTDFSSDNDLNKQS